MPPINAKQKNNKRRPITKDVDTSKKLEQEVQKREDDARLERALAHKNLGNEAFKAQDWLSAIEHFTNAIEEDDTDKVFFSNRSAANLSMKRTADAVDDAEECVRLAPEWVKGYSRLGAALWADRQLAEASEAYEKGAKLEGPASPMIEAKKNVDKEIAEEEALKPKEEAAAEPAEKVDIEPVIGIDLGTTYSAVAVWDEVLGGVRMLADESGSNTVASYVAWGEDGERVIGDRAKQMAARLPGRALFDIKRLIGRKEHDLAVQEEKKRLPFGIVKGDEDRVEIDVQIGASTKRFVPEEVSAMVLGKMKDIAEKNLGRKISKAVVTVPAYFNDAQRKSTQAAGAIAGLEVLRIINEPTAAALGYGLDQKEKFGMTRGAHVLIFDLGGGTFDVSVLHIEDGMVEVKSTGGDTRLGGEDFDNYLVDHILTQLKIDPKKADAKVRAKVKRAAETLKRELSTNETAHVDIETLGTDQDGQITFTRAEFEKLCAPLFEKCFATVKAVLKDAKLTEKDIDDIVLVGGSTRVPCIQQTLSKNFGGKDLCKSIHPDEAVAYGAAVQGAILSGVRTSATTQMLLIDVTPLSLGIETEGRHHSIIIPRNSSIPCSKSSTYTTTENYQEDIDVCVYEGERPCVDSNRLLGEFTITGIERAKAGEAQIDVSFSLDANGVLQVTAQDKKTKAKAECTISGACKGLDPAEVARMLKEAEEMKEQDDDYKEKLDLRSTLEELAYGSEEEEEVLEWLDGLDLGSTSKVTLEKKIKAMKKLAASGG